MKSAKIVTDQDKHNFLNNVLELLEYMEIESNHVLYNQNIDFIEYVNFVTSFLAELSPPKQICNCHYCWHQQKVIDALQRLNQK